METLRLTDDIRRWFSPNWKPDTELDEEYLIRSGVRARRIKAAQNRGEDPKKPQYKTRKELTILNRFYAGEPPSASVMITITALGRFLVVPGVENWCAIARLIPAGEEEIGHDKKHRVLGEIICAGPDMPQEEAVRLTHLWIADSYGALASAPDNVEIPSRTPTGRVAARIRYSIQQPPVTH